MSKIKIKSVLKSKNENHIFEGKGIKDNNKIIYNDNGVITKITIDNNIILERISDYSIKLGFNINENIKGTYNTPEGTLKTETKTEYIKFEKNSIKIKYKLMINNVFIDSFEFNLQYAIDR